MDGDDVFEKNVPFLDTDYARGIWRRKKIYVYAKRVIGDLLVMNLVSERASPNRNFWQNEPCRLINSWGKFWNICGLKFFDSLIMIAWIQKRFSAFEFVSPVALSLLLYCSFL